MTFLKPLWILFYLFQDFKNLRRLKFIKILFNSKNWGIQFIKLPILHNEFTVCFNAIVFCNKFIHILQILLFLLFQTFDYYRFARFMLFFIPIFKLVSFNGLLTQFFLFSLFEYYLTHLNLIIIKLMPIL